MKELKLVFEQLNIPWDERKERQLNGYMEEILERNRHINLTAITDREEFIQKHYVDSLLCAGSREFLDAETIIDVGTGGGFPGVPLAIAFPRKKFVLVDSLNKRIKIIDELCSLLGIDNVTVIHGRAEELGRRKELRETFDLCVSRAVANMSTLAEYCLPFVKAGGTFIAYKGPECGPEVEEAGGAIQALGGQLLRNEKAGLELRPQTDAEYTAFPFQHRLIFIGKVRQTASKYPRKPGTPSKEPLK